jgi:hypothetical protein
MRTVACSTLCLAEMAFMFFAPGLFCQSAGVNVTFSLIHSPIDCTEPVIVSLQFENLTSEPLHLNLGSEKPDRIYFMMQGPSGQKELHEPRPATFDQVGSFGQRTSQTINGGTVPWIWSVIEVSNPVKRVTVVSATWRMKCQWNGTPILPPF